MASSTNQPEDPSFSLELLEGSIQFFNALIASLDAARYTVHLETYIFDFTASSVDVAQALERAAQRGVVVRVVVDGFGTPAWPPEWAARFKSAGVQTLVFEPIVTLGFFIPSQWRRLHRKLCVIDGEVAFCGGVNILDDFYDPNYGVLTAPRFDFSVRVTGTLALTIHAITGHLWERMLTGALGTPGSSNKVLTAIDFLSNQTRRYRFRNKQAQALQPKAYLVLRDNLGNRTKIERAYLKAIGESRQEIIIANAYFLPGAKLRKALIHAAGRGVKVQLLLQGKYEYFMQFHAARPVYGPLLAAGIEIHEYAPSYLHAKVAVIDKVWATVGSSNLDPMSLLLAREANIVVHDANFANSLRERLLQAMQTEGKRLDPEQFAHRPLLQRMRDRVAFWVMRMGLWIFSKRY
ncbi:MAG: cardiolipin synthase ClsB [Burkholderiaceae bacterium]|nr:cardiolipin synthase ClsB [Burkholderiaceae bacterium]